MSEGLRGLYVGIGPTVQRAAILTATQVRPRTSAHLLTGDHAGPLPRRSC